MRRLSGALLGAALPLAAGAQTREIEAGLENYWYRTAETPLNRDNILGLAENEDLLRGVVSWKERHGDLQVLFKGYAERAFGSQDETTWATRQAYVQYGWGPGLSVRVGKQRIAWGSGFAWNPTNRLEAPKNPANTSLEQVGARAVRLDVLPASWAGLILVAARADPKASDLPFPTGGDVRNSGALRARFLVADTDVALVATGGQRQPSLLGLDVGRSLGSVAVHAEMATYRGSEIAPARPDERFYRIDAGALWTRATTSLALEYFFNGEGYDDREAKAYVAALDASHAAATDPSLPEPVRDAALERYLATAAVPFSAGLGLRRHYLHAALTRSEIAGKWTASARAVIGLSDGGAALTPGLAWAPQDHLSISVDGVLLLGPPTSEYRLAPLRGAIQARVRALF